MAMQQSIASPSTLGKRAAPFAGDAEAPARKQARARVGDDDQLAASENAASTATYCSLSGGEASNAPTATLNAAPSSACVSYQESHHVVVQSRGAIDGGLASCGVQSSTSSAYATAAAAFEADFACVSLPPAPAVSSSGICRHDMSGMAVLIAAQLRAAAAVAAQASLSSTPAAAAGAPCASPPVAPAAGALAKGSNRGCPSKPKYPHGNYHRYYGYRFSDAFEEDPRLKVLRSEWFERRECLDVGCNEGKVTIPLAARFRCSRMHGVDIDSKLVQMANKNLRREASATQQQQRGRAAAAAAKQRLAALSRVSFEHADFVSMASPPVGRYDTVLCLSVTKWVHLNGGDTGLREFFGRLVAALRPGGLLVVEPQPWKSYQQAKRKQETSSADHVSLTQLTLRPEGFGTYLQASHSMTLVAALQCQQQAQRGFGRPILVLRKPGEEACVTGGDRGALPAVGMLVPGGTVLRAEPTAAGNGGDDVDAAHTRRGEREDEAAVPGGTVLRAEPTATGSGSQDGGALPAVGMLATGGTVLRAEPTAAGNGGDDGGAAHTRRREREDEAAVPGGTMLRAALAAAGTGGEDVVAAHACRVEGEDEAEADAVPAVPP